MFLPWATWEHEYKDSFVNIDECVIFTKLGQHVNEMIAVTAKKFKILVFTYRS